MNQIIIHGRLVRDPELKTAASGNEFCKFTVAVDRRRKEDLFFTEEERETSRFSSKGRMFT